MIFQIFALALRIFIKFSFQEVFVFQFEIQVFQFMHSLANVTIFSKEVKKNI